MRFRLDEMLARGVGIGVVFCQYAVENGSIGNLCSSLEIISFDWSWCH